MANKKVKMIMELDFISNKQSLESIKKDMDKLKQTVELNLDKASADKLKEDIDTLGLALGASLNKSTGKINLKSLNTALENNHLEVEKLNTSFRNAGINGSKSFGAVGKANQYLQGELKNTNTVLDKMGYTLANTIRWNISASAVNAITGEFRKMYYYAKDLDRALTNIRIVSGESANNMDRFAIAANKSAKELKVSTIAYAEAATLFYQQGLRGEDVLHMTEASIIGANITGQSAAEMSNLLTAVMRGYKVATEDVLTVTDKLAAVGANTAADFNELATGMSKVASMANAAGVDLDSLNAQLATIVSVTRESPESIGTSLKTIYGRMLMFKTDTDALMKDEDGEVFGAPNVEKALQAYSRVTGEQISLFRTTKDGKRELRDLGEVIEEIGNSWDKTTDKTAKFGIATALAGSRQQNRLVALFDSWDMYKDAMQTSLDAEGTSLRQNALYMESYEGRLEGLQAAKEELYMVFTNTDGLKDFISGLTKAVELVSFIAEKTGGLYGVIGLIGAALSKMATIKISDSVTRLEGVFQPREKTADSPEARDAEKLHKIQRTYGLERAKMEREQLLNAKKIHLNHKIEQELLLEKRTNLERVNVLLEKRNMSESQRKGIIEQIKTENLELGISNDSIEKLIKSHDKLKIADVELRKARASFNEQGTRENAEKLQEASKRVKELREEIKEIHNDIEDNITRSGKNIETAKKSEDKTQANYDKLAKDADRLRGIITGVQTVMLTMPAIVNAITDETKSGEEVLKTVATVSIPAILNGLLRHGPAILTSVKAAGGLKLALSGLGLPIAAAVAGVTLIGTALFKATREAKQLDIALNNLETTSEELEKVEQNYENISKQLLDIRERRKEIKELNDSDDTTDEEKKALEEELELLDIKYGKLQEEKIIEKMLLKVAREKAELAAKEAMEATMKSEYAFTTDYYGFEQKRDATLTEELEYATEAYIKAEENITKYRKSLAELESSENASAREIKNTQKALDNARETRDKATKNIDLHSSSIRKIIKDLGDEEGANKELIKTLQEYLDVSSETIAKTLGIGEAFKDATPEEFADGMYEVVNQTKETIKQIGIFSKNMSTLDSAYAQLISNNKLTASNLTALQEQFGNTDGFEDFIDIVGSATSVTSDVQEAFDSLVGSYLETSEMMEILDEGNKDLIVSQLELEGVINAEEIANELLANRVRELTVEQEALALEKEFVTKKGYDLTDATWEEINALINQEMASDDTRQALAKLALEKITLNNEKLDFSSDIDQIIGLANAAGASATALANLKNAKDITSRIGPLELHEHQNLKKLMEDVTSGNFDYQFTPLNANVYKKAIYSGGGGSKRNAGSSRANRAGSSRANRAGSSSKRDQYKAEADAYAQINFELDRNNVLLQLNKTYQDQAGSDIAKKIKLMDKEIELNEERQDLLHQYNTKMRTEAKLLQKDLAGIFKFEGSWDDNSMTITNMDAIEGKSEDIEKKFKRIIAIMGELPKGSQEWTNLNGEIQKIELDKLVMEFELADKTFENINESISDLEYALKMLDPDDFNGKIDNNVKTLAKLKEEVEDTTRQLEELGENGFEAGTKKSDAFIARQVELTARLKEGKLAAKEYERSLVDLIRSQTRETIEAEKRNAYMDLDLRQRRANEQFKADRERMDADISRKQSQIDRIQVEIDRIQESERARAESLERTKRLEEISKLQDKYYHLQYTNLANMTEEQAKLVGLEKEREQYLERQTRLQELQLKLTNLQNEKNIQQLIKRADGTWDFDYVADQKAIDDTNKQIEDLQKEHDKTIKDLKDRTLEDLKKAQEDYSEWERQNDIRRQIEAKQRRIKDYQDEIKDLQDKFAEKERITNEEFAKEKQALDDYYTDIDLLTETKLDELKETFDGKWTEIAGVISSQFDAITRAYEEMVNIVSRDFDMGMPRGGEGFGGGQYGGGGGGGGARYEDYDDSGSSKSPSSSSKPSSSSSSPNYGVGASTGQSARDNEARLNSDSAYRNSEIERAKEVISNRKQGGMDTSAQEKYLDRLIKGSYAQGGKITETGTFLANFHGKTNKPEWIFNDSQLQNVLKSAVLSTMNISMPKMPKVALSGVSGSGDTIYYIDELNVPTNDFQSFIKDFTSVVENHPNKTIMKVKKIGGLK